MNRIGRRRTWWVLAGWAGVLAGLSGCATEPEREMLSVDAIANYQETAEEERYEAGGGARVGPAPTPAKCHVYLDRIEAMQTTRAVAATVSGISALVGLLSGSDDVAQVAGLVAAGGTLVQAGAATEAQRVANEAIERGCRF